MFPIWNTPLGLKLLIKNDIHRLFLDIKKTYKASVHTKTELNSQHRTCRLTSLLLVFVDLEKPNITAWRNNLWLERVKNKEEWWKEAKRGRGGVLIRRDGAVDVLRSQTKKLNSQTQLNSTNVLTHLRLLAAGKIKSNSDVWSTLESVSGSLVSHHVRVPLWTLESK